MATNTHRTQMNHQQMRRVLEYLGFWTHERPGRLVRKGPSKDCNPFPGLFLNERARLAYFTLKPIGGNIQLPRGRCPDLALWVELAPHQVGPKQSTGGRRNYAPRDGQECEAVREFLC